VQSCGGEMSPTREPSDGVRNERGPLTARHLGQRPARRARITLRLAADLRIGAARFAETFLYNNGASICARVGIAVNRCAREAAAIRSLIRIAPCVALLTNLLTADVHAASSWRVRLDIRMPNQTWVHLTVRDGERRSVDAPGIGIFAFQPLVVDADQARVRVNIFERRDDGWRPLGNAIVDVGHPVADSVTSPSFRIRLVRLGHDRHDWHSR
jgi:hypothetical protein